MLSVETTDPRYRAAIADMAKIVEDQKEILAGWNGDVQPELTETKVSFNGIEELGQAHESFVIEGPTSFEFCKTAQKPYDVAVTACLAVLSEHLGDDVKVTSDGSVGDWQEGLELAKKVLGRPFLYPVRRK